MPEEKIMKKDVEIEDMKFEDAITTLEEINDRLEREKVSLEEAIKLYENGVKLIEHCSEKLEEAEGEIKEITEDNGDMKNGLDP